MYVRSYLLLTLCAGWTLAQQITEVWQTTEDQKQLFAQVKSHDVSFGTPGPEGQANIIVDHSKVFQQMDGFGASLTDSSAKVLSQLKSKSFSNYQKLLNQLFSSKDPSGAGLTAIRVGLGATDFSEKVYSFDNEAGAGSIPKELFSTLDDIAKINNNIKIFLLPWSPPASMKSTKKMNGGTLNDEDVDDYASYILQGVQAFKSKGHTPYSVGIQNEPQNNNPTYPTALVSASLEAKVGTKLRSLLDSNGLQSVKIIGYEHNWSDAGAYPVELMKAAGNAFAGVAFHCYAGDVKNQTLFHNAFPDKEVYHSECTGTFKDSDWWSNIKWYMDNLFIGSPENFGRTAMMWNYALNGKGNPLLPGTDSCGGGCRGVVTVSGSKVTLNEEFYAMAQASRAIIPQTGDGAFAQRMGVEVRGSTSFALRVGAYKADAGNSQTRFSLVVMNWNDNGNGKFKPTPVETTIAFRGKQAKMTFPVGVTTLSWFA